MKSDGYKVAKRVKTIQQKTLVLWGRQDNILNRRTRRGSRRRCPTARSCGWKTVDTRAPERPEFMRDTLFEFADVKNEAVAA